MAGIVNYEALVVSDDDIPNKKYVDDENLVPTYSYLTKSAAYTLTADDYQVECDTGSFILDLPDASGITGKVYSIKNTGAGTITASGNFTQTIDGERAQTLEQWDNMMIMSNASGWIII